MLNPIMLNPIIIRLMGGFHPCHCHLPGVGDGMVEDIMAAGMAAGTTESFLENK
jgi:hypothetical protein